MASPSPSGHNINNKRDRKQRQTYPGPNSADNQQMLQDIRHTLDQHQRERRTPTPTSAALSATVERQDSREREQLRRSPPSEVTANGSPSATPRMKQNRPSAVPTKQLASSRTRRQLATIRHSLRPFASGHSDPGFHAAKDKVNQKMLEELICHGYNENSAVPALLACNSSSVENALDILQQEPPKQKLTAIREDELTTRPHTLAVTGREERSLSDDKKMSSPEDSGSEQRRSYDSRTSPERTLSGTSLMHPDQRADSACQYDMTDIPRISPISLPGFQTPVTFSDLPPPSTPPVTKQAPSYYTTYFTDAETHSDSSPTRTSPPYIHTSPPPYPSATPTGSTMTHIERTHVHVSPPPDVRPQSYSPISAPYSYRQLPQYDTQRRMPQGYGMEMTRVTPTTGELSDSGIEEEATPHRPSVPPEAFKFFMEQHIDNIYKSYQQRQQRRMKLEMEMAKRNLDEATSEQMRRILYQKESNFLRMKRAKMHQRMFDTVKPLGIGAFGVVSLVRKKDTGKLYAMKTLRKVDVLRRNQVAHVKAERDILAEADNEWVVKLFFSFQDSENLYFVMEYIPGGDMMSLLIKLGTFPEHLALFYIAELVCAIESVHRMGFIHRDIKPDNILIGGDGHIKLTDFGLCTGFRWTHDSRHYQPKGTPANQGHSRQGSIEPQTWDDDVYLKPLELKRVREHRCIAHSLVGTPNYIAPEILRRIGYTQLCDWWSVGVIMYEMLVGQPPFMAPTPSETQVKIMNWQQYLHIHRHASMSPSAANLILSLCSDPAERIGKNGSDEIKRHSFFSAIDWDVGIRKYEPPYVPKIMYDADTSNFDPIPQSQLQRLETKRGPEVSSLPKGQPEHAFYEWTFIRFYPERGGRDKRPTLTPSSVYNGPSHSHSHSHTHAHAHDSTGATSSPATKERRKGSTQPVYV